MAFFAVETEDKLEITEWFAKFQDRLKLNVFFNGKVKCFKNNNKLAYHL